LRTPKRPVQNDVTVRNDLAVQSDGAVRNDVEVPLNGSPHNLSVDTAAEPSE